MASDKKELEGQRLRRTLPGPDIQKNIESFIKCIEILLVGAADETGNDDNIIIVRSNDAERLLTSRNFQATLPPKVEITKPKTEWKCGGLTKIFSDLGYKVENNKNTALVDKLFSANQNYDTSGDSTAPEQTILYSPATNGKGFKNFNPPRQKRFLNPRVLDSAENENDEQLLPHPNKPGSKDNLEVKEIVLNDFCKRIGQPNTNSGAFGWKANETENEAAGQLLFIKEVKDDKDQAGTSVFRTAYEKLIIDDKLKGVKRPYLPPPGTNVHVSGLRKMPRLDNNTQNSNGSAPQKNVKANDEDGSSNPEVQELMLDERIKNVEAKMIEAILNEIIETNVNTQWEDIAGLHGPKAIIKEIIIWPLQRPDIFTGLRGPPKGVLLFGPPGTGKTLIGKLIATQSKSTFFSISASSLTSKWIGDGEKMVRALFQVARVKQPAVIFIDEIDSILTQRNDTEHESSRRLKTEFLIQFDGCGTVTEDRILVIGVTNRPQELDEAARRRLVKRIYIPLPDAEGRKHLVKRTLTEQDSSLTEDDFMKIAEMTAGYSGSDMSSLVREAAYGPIRDIGQDIENISVDKVRAIELKDFQLALKHVKASVAAHDLSFYEDWDNQFGCHV